MAGLIVDRVSADFNPKLGATISVREKEPWDHAKDEVYPTALRDDVALHLYEWLVEHPAVVREFDPDGTQRDKDGRYDE